MGQARARKNWAGKSPKQERGRQELQAQGRQELQTIDMAGCRYSRHAGTKYIHCPGVEQPLLRHGRSELNISCFSVHVVAGVLGRLPGPLELAAGGVRRLDEGESRATGGNFKC